MSNVSHVATVLTVVTGSVGRFQREFGGLMQLSLGSMFYKEPVTFAAV